MTGYQNINLHIICHLAIHARGSRRKLTLLTRAARTYSYILTVYQELLSRL